jgi:cyclophilin family peptidyl-prolyl cis-trans isomerase
MRLAAIAACVALVACGGAATTPSRAPTTRPASTVAPTAAVPAPCPPIPAGTPTKTATLELVKGGVIKMALRPDKAPNTVATFTAKANSGAYNGLTFHRVEPGFVVQGGDPQGDGRGGGTQPTELSDLPFCLGSIGIARGGDIKVSNDSQFFICIGSCRHLDGMYTNFGQVTSGIDVAAAIKVGDKIKTLTVQ